MSASAEFRAETVAIVGVGLIGGSLGAALKRRGLASRVIGVGRNPQRLQDAQHWLLIDDYTSDLRAAAVEAELIIFCTPVNHIVAGVRLACETARPGTLLTDAGSVKGSICAALADLATGPVVFIGAHPLAGSEKTGHEHASAELFEQRTCVITPLPAHARSDVGRLERFWRQLGMNTVRMTPAEHDAALARTSHAPHLIAAALAAALKDEQRSLTASGFRDTTRIAAGDPELWTSILLQNADAVCAGLIEVDATLAEFRGALERRDEAALKKLLQTAKRNREALG